MRVHGVGGWDATAGGSLSPLSRSSNITLKLNLTPLTLTHHRNKWQRRGDDGTIVMVRDLPRHEALGTHGKREVQNCGNVGVEVMVMMVVAAVVRWLRKRSHGVVVSGWTGG